jgi:hypothetical protein
MIELNNIFKFKAYLMATFHWYAKIIWLFNLPCFHLTLLVIQEKYFENHDLQVSVKLF